jgi:hypothetical protein
VSYEFFELAPSKSPSRTRLSGLHHRYARI